MVLGIHLNKELCVLTNNYFLLRKNQKGYTFVYPLFFIVYFRSNKRSLKSNIIYQFKKDLLLNRRKITPIMNHPNKIKNE